MAGLIQLPRDYTRGSAFPAFCSSIWSHCLVVPGWRYFCHHTCRRSKEKGEKVRPSRQASVCLYLKRKSFLNAPPPTPRRFPPYLNNHSEILWGLHATNKTGKRRFSKRGQIILYRVIIPSPAPKIRDERGWGGPL